MSNELVVFAAPVKDLPPEKWPAWQTLGRGKVVLDAGLQKYSLELSGILTDYEKTKKENVTELTKKLDLYKKKHGEMVDFRKSFTKHLDALVSKCMVAEKEANYDAKRGDVNKVYSAAAALELKLREEVQADDQKRQNKANEKAALIAHVKNEYARVGAGYNMSLKTIISQAYRQCLEQKTPVDNIHIAMSAAKDAMREVRPGIPDKKSLVLLTVDEAKEATSTIPQPPYAEMWKEALQELVDKFSLYANDLANAPAAIEAEQQEHETFVIDASAAVEAEAATTTILEKADAYVAPSAGVKAVIEKTQIKIKTDDPKWVMAIMAAFMNNFQPAFSKVKVEDYSKLNLGQMAKALDMAQVTVLTVEYEKIKK